MHTRFARLVHHLFCAFILEQLDKPNEQNILIIEKSSTAHCYNVDLTFLTQRPAYDILYYLYFIVFYCILLYYTNVCDPL